MKYIVKPVLVFGLGLVALVFLLGVEILPPAFAIAALRDYGIYMSPISGSSAMRLDVRIRKTDTDNTKTERWFSRTNLKSKGFIWDPRFMTFEGGISYSSTKSKSDSGDVDYTATGFNLTAVLFPGWRYPYRPIQLRASKFTNETDSFSGDISEVDVTAFGVNWGIGHKLLGRVRLSYDVQLTESAKNQDDEEFIWHRLYVDSGKDILKGKWGESKLRYGYNLEYSETKGENSDNSFLQNYVYARSTTKFGEKMDLSVDVNLHQRTTDSSGSVPGGGERDSTLFTAYANLKIDQTERLRQYHRLSVARNDSDGVVASNFNESSNLNYIYRHTFDKYWTGRLSATGGASFFRSSPGDSGSRGDTAANGSLNYRKAFGEFMVSGIYNLSFTQPLWDNINNTQPSRTNQLARIRYSRSDNPLYSDRAELQLSSTYGDTQSQMYSLDYDVNSKLTAKDWLFGSANHRISRSDSGITTSSISARGRWQHTFSRFSDAQLRADHRLTTTEAKNKSRSSIDIRYSVKLLRRRNLRFYGTVFWERNAADDEPDSDRFRGAAGLTYPLGKFKATLDYSYSSFGSGEGTKTVDQRIMLELIRSFTLRL